MGVRDDGSKSQAVISEATLSGHEILDHLEKLSQKIEADLKEIMMVTSERMSKCQGKRGHICTSWISGRCTVKAGQI